MDRIGAVSTFVRAVRARLRPRPAATAGEDPQQVFEVASPFLEDEKFLQAYAAGKATGSWWGFDLEWRASVICWAALQGKRIAGDFVECGVHRGGYARMAVEYIDFAALADRRFFLIDTYAGVPERFLTGSAAIFENVYGDSYEDVARTFATWPNVHLVRGIVPDVLPDVVLERVAFLSIDLNAAAPSAAALEHFWPLLSPGAAAVLDDYGFAWFADQREALDAAAARLGAPILALPTGQGVMIKA